MTQYLLIPIVLVTLFLLEKLYFIIAKHYNIVDKPNERSSHKVVTLRGGGIIFTLAVLMQSVVYGISYPYFLLGLLMVAIISFIDDIKPQRASVRLVFQFAAMLLLFYQLQLFQLAWWAIPIALVLFVGIINAYNFMDGVNGITGGYSLIVLGALYYVNSYQVEFVEPSFLLFSILGVLVFLFFNFRKKARCFAGDVGSISIAFIILFALGGLIVKTGDLSYLVFLMVYGVDAALTIAHRIILKENISQPHRKHVYQLMANELGIKHTYVSMIYMLTQLAINIVFISLAEIHWIMFGVILILLSCVYICVISKYFHLHLQHKTSNSK
ncbi:MAG: MraY family glycosyltransferase [Marinifilaceae bacterium]